RREATADEMVAIIVRALKEVSLSIGDLAFVAAIDEKANEPTFINASKFLGVSITTVNRNELQMVADKIQTHSPRVLALHGVGSLAEATALASAGPGASLILPRIASDRVTCALARGEPQ
ncbi:cobalamin biosynthesis protein, partial [Corallococcus exiguus]|uniref:cobalamin biosynthesis protein n=1 Tax=Corallococcus exiguus TaxID=83462 RepID=UPI0014727758